MPKWLEYVNAFNGDFDYDCEIPEEEKIFLDKVNPDIRKIIWATYNRNNINYINIGFRRSKWD